DRAVDEERNQGFVLARTAFALEIATRDLTGGEVFFLVVDGQREEVLAGLGRLCRNDSGQKHGFAQGGEHGAIGLAGNLAGFERQGLAAPVELDLVVIKLDRHESSSFHSAGGAGTRGLGECPTNASGVPAPAS